MEIGMKRLSAAVTTGFIYLANAATALAAVDLGQVEPPKDAQGKSIGVDPNIKLNKLLSNGLTIIFIVAALFVLYQLIMGGVNWIMSGGDKDAIGKARNRIINALIGLAVLAVAYFLAVFGGQLVGIDLFKLTSIPSLGENP